MSALLLLAGAAIGIVAMRWAAPVLWAHACAEIENTGAVRSALWVAATVMAGPLVAAVLVLLREVG